MPVTHLVHTILRPGVQSIQVQYKYQSSEVWTNYSDGQRIPGGVDVKFTVTTYTNFTLTEWKAWYSDAYDDTVDLALTPVTGESSWIFTLPSADVYIRCEAESEGGGGGESSTIPWLPYSIPTSYSGTAEFSHLRSLSPTEILSALSYIKNVQWMSSVFYTVLNRLESFVIDNSLTYVTFAYWRSNQNTVDIVYFEGTPPWVPGTSYVVNWGNSFTPPLWNPMYRSYMTLAFTVLDSVITNCVVSEIAHQLEQYPYYWSGLVETGRTMVSSTCVVGMSEQTFPYPTLVDETRENAIRYIMSPENSGEVDASAPSEFIQGTTEFTFKWRIKAAYEFRRLTPFAIGEGSLEDDVEHSLQYDGDTRTYTFTVSSIPDWAIGVRVLIETIMTGDPSSSIGDNSSDGPIGGNGTFDDTSDEVPLPGIPEGVSAPDTGFVTLFRPTIAQIKDLSNYMWSNISEFIENLQKIFTNPMDYVISLASFPVTPDVGPDRSIYVGNFLTNIQMPPITRQFYEFNCGTVNISEYFGSFLDYAPNTRARIMLPFIGDADLAINEIMGKTLHLWYRIDLLSGACVAVLTIDNSVYYQWTGNCSIQIPVTASDFSRLYAGIARVGITAAAVTAGGAYLGALASTASGWNSANAGWHGDFGNGYSPTPNFGIPALPSAYGQLSTEFAADRGPQLNMSDYMSYTPPMQIPSKKSRAVAAAAGGSFIGHNIMNAIPRVQHAGGMSGNIGIMGNRTPFIVLEYPNVSMPENYKHIFGYPSNMYKVLGDLAGYTKCKQVLFESTRATDDEYEMVIEALKGGVYL